MFGRLSAGRAAIAASLGMSAIAGLVLGIGPGAMAAPTPVSPQPISVEGGTLQIRPPARAPGAVNTFASAGLTDGTYNVHSQSSSSTSHIWNTFATTVVLSGDVTKMTLKSGKATTYWTGSGSGTVDIDVHYWVTGLDVQVETSGASGWIGEQDLDYRGHATKVTQTSDTSSGAVFVGILITFNENVTSSWYVGGNSYHLTTN